jgi:hypothetical protein
VTRRLAHEPFGWRPTTLLVTVRRYRCTGCGHVWRQNTSRAAEPRVTLSRRGLRWALEGIVVQHLTVARVADGLGVSWNTANDAVLAEGRRVLIDGPGRFDGVAVVGVDEHAWRHTHRGDKYVTVIIDLTAVRAGTSRRGRDHGPVPRGALGRRRTGRVPTTRTTGPTRAPRPQGRPALQRPPDPAHRSRPAHRQAGCSTAGLPVGQPRGHLRGPTRRSTRIVGTAIRRLVS